MRKTSLSLALLVAFALPSFCLEIALNDGRVYNDARIANRTPDGVDIVSHNDMDITVYRHVRYSEMTESTLKKFPDYDKPKADDYLVGVRATHEKAVAKNKGLYTQWSEQTASGSPVVFPVSSANKMRVVFKATKGLEHGTIGWASTEDSDESVKHFGKIYVQGLTTTEGNEWVGEVFLTNKFMVDKNETCPCYAMSKEDAAKIDKRAQ